jgi:hypothetical protein
MLHPPILQLKIVGPSINQLLVSSVTHIIDRNFWLIIVVAKTCLFFDLG